MDHELKKGVDNLNEIEYGATVGPPIADGPAEGEVAEQNVLFRALARLFEHGVEARGIERVPDEERSDKHAIGLFLMWLSVNVVLSTFPIGVRYVH
jgi:hypothetical protein